MNVIEKTKEILTNSELIKQFTNNISIDFNAQNDDENFGLSPIGDSLIRENIAGDQVREHNFILYARNQAFNDYERLANSSFLLELTWWLEEQKNIKIDRGKILSIEASNGMLYEVIDADINDGCLYQLQMKVIYEREAIK